MDCAGIAVAITFAMAFLGRLYFERLRKVVGLPYVEGRKKHEPIPIASEEEILGISSKSPAYLTATVGLLGLLAILYLMISSHSRKYVAAMVHSASAERTRPWLTD